MQQITPSRTNDLAEGNLQNKLGRNLLSIALRLDKDPGPLPGEVEQAEGSAGGTAFALFPAARGGDRHIEKCGKNGLAYIKPAANSQDIMGLDGFNAGREQQFGDSKGEFSFPFELLRVPPQATQQEPGIKFNLLRRTPF
jgi:hypothetical protein